MKKILVLIVASTIFISCWVKEVPEWDRTYQIQNSTGYNITIRVFENYPSNGLFFEDIILQNEEIYLGNDIGGRSFSDPYSDPDNISPASSFNSLRMILVFNNERRIEHTRIDTDEDNITDSFSEPISRNLLRGGNYTDIGNDFFEFVLTEEDYNNAEPCDGDCLD